MNLENLTELELVALLPNVVNLSDGHARQSLGVRSRVKVQEVFDSFMSSSAPDYFQSERQFLKYLTQYTGQQYVEGQFFVTYASSVAMGVVATQLKRSGRHVGVVCPTFDNIPGILATLDVPMVPVAEKYLSGGCDFGYLSSLDIDALLLVMPNNPTGTCLTRESMCGLFDWAAQRDVELIIDLAFRWFSEDMRWDIVCEAEERGVDVITIDDTGKVLSLADLKASVISTSRRLAVQVREIQTQYVLNVSELTLRLLTVMMEPTRLDNEVSEAIRTVRANRQYLHRKLAVHDPSARHALSSTPCYSDMSVEWLRFSSNNRTQIVKECRRRGLEILVGDHFYWAAELKPSYEDVRLALMRDSHYFARGIDILMEVLNGQLGG